ncbi:hypothetical protein [Pelagibius sp. Alg239-R121]|uniref:hypothetical protein n=1 Tax=Pelagibius sp. Alg239-R121 TaxID=2993448 RepID=UPI0024A713A8|nr:hypothetical protein [Pelagibius sp. Alg239-R121]
MNDLAPICAGFWSCVFAFQTLIAGLLAVIAAAGTAYAVWRSAHIPAVQQERHERDQQRRRRRHGANILAGELSHVSERAHQAAATIKVIIAANKTLTEEMKDPLYLKPPATLSNWEVTSLFPDEYQRRCIDFTNLINRHNFHVARAGGVFGDTNSQKTVQRRVKSISDIAHRLRNDLDPQNGTVKVVPRTRDDD